MTDLAESIRKHQEDLDKILGIAVDESSLGIVSVWADRDGRALVWRRVPSTALRAGPSTSSGQSDEQILCEEQRFRPWLFAATLDDLAYLGAGLLPEGAPGADTATISYRELDGPAGSYRFLISARSGRALERMLLTGAQRRLGRPIDSLYNLDDDYYRVGPVEQYLMQSGRVCFRGLTYLDLHRLQFDLETTALDPRRGRIFMVAVRDSRGLAVTLDAPAPEDEPRLIADLCALICARDPDVIENHNLFGFDMPFLEQRAAILGLPLPLGRRDPALPEHAHAPLLDRYAETPYAGPGNRRRQRFRYTVMGRELIDTLDAVRRHDFVARDLPSHGLKDVARVFGIATAERVYLAGAEVFPTYRQDPERVRRYALDDVAEVDGLSRQLLGATFALAGMAPRRYERLASAGPAMGILEPMLVRAYLRAGAALPRQAGGQDTELGPHSGGAAYLLAAGVAEYVVKADIASLYPSLMRTYQIGPACDRLNVLLRIVSRLTDLRLAHKDAARAAERGSLERSQHNAIQAAMKLIINSAYGYMGAGPMALFADRRAADEVTRRGREVLDQVLAALRERGMALIEADTDGVYFAVPAGWDAERERALVAEIGTTLPAGIRLEYEGRYRSMLSHEIKNYALLTYDGQLIVRGGALRSSRSEPFGERFLRQALRYAMTGDVAELRNVYMDVVAAIRERALRAADLATRVRLTKTPEAYQESRAGHREAAYEALLAAGRTEWAPGERVRCYRVPGNAYVWLPDETEDVTFDDEEDQAVDEGASEVGGEEAISSRSLALSPSRTLVDDRRDYDIDHYLNVLLTSYAGRLRKAFAPDDFAQLFRADLQLGMFDQPIDSIQPKWIRCGQPASPEGDSVPDRSRQRGFRKG
ncbi:MAG TPA: DNA polymerase domain-containing protein [Roseiflexaceae bacterium]|nr:DNA polymerase domain-containing protein [Roseiflexaceae bacterium]